MSALLLETLWSYLAGFGATIVALAAAYLGGRKAGAAKAETTSLKKEAAAKDELLEMHREADAQELEAARMSEEQARKEAMTWPGR